jgi:hypothetical protein
MPFNDLGTDVKPKAEAGKLVPQAIYPVIPVEQMRQFFGVYANPIILHMYNGHPIFAAESRYLSFSIAENI